MSHLDFHSCFPSFGDKMTYVNNICESEQNGMNGFYVACMCSIEDLFENKNEMVDYAFQDINDIPSALPEGRTKPWGTGQAVLAELLSEGKMSVKVLRTNDTWYGMTYKEDVAAVKESFSKMLEDGTYKGVLFSDL